MIARSARIRMLAFTVFTYLSVVVLRVGEGGRRIRHHIRLERAVAGEGVAPVLVAHEVVRRRPAHENRIPNLPAFRAGLGRRLRRPGPPERGAGP